MVQCTCSAAALHLTPTLASTTTGSSTTEGYGSFHLSHPFSSLPLGFPFCVLLGFVVAFAFVAFPCFDGNLGTARFHTTLSSNRDGA